MLYDGFLGHNFAITMLQYAPQHDLLLGAGFDYDVRPCVVLHVSLACITSLFCILRCDMFVMYTVDIWMGPGNASSTVTAIRPPASYHLSRGGIHPG